LIRPEVLEFIRGALKTVWALELLLIMRRRRAQLWSIDALVSELRGSRNIVNEAIATFVQAGLVREEKDGFCYGPASPRSDQIMEELEAIYSERPNLVINAIMSAQNDKLQNFANAFRLKRD